MGFHVDVVLPAGHQNMCPCTGNIAGMSAVTVVAVAPLLAVCGAAPGVVSG